MNIETEKNIIDKKLYIDSNTLSKKLDNVIINESKILRKNLKKSENINNNIPYSYA